MRITNNPSHYAQHFIITWIFYFGILGNAYSQIREIEGNYDRKPVYAKSLIDESLRDPRIMNRTRISHAYVSSRDSFVITLFDMDENGSFVDPKDVISVSTMNDSLAPIIPNNNSNAAYFSSGLMFDFYGTKYEITSASSDGKQIDLHQTPSKDTSPPQLIVTDQVSDKLMVSEINSSQSFNLLKTIQSQDKKYVLLDFWSPYCPPCFENIPTLRKFKDNGIAIINIFFMEDDEVKLVENQISKFEIPGLNFKSSPELIKYFSQNGFPYTVLVDPSTGKMLLSTHWIREQEKYLNF